MLGEATGRTGKEGNGVCVEGLVHQKNPLGCTFKHTQNPTSSPPPLLPCRSTPLSLVQSPLGHPVSALPCSRLLSAARALHAVPVSSKPRAPIPHGVTGDLSPPVRPTRCPLTSLPSPASLGSLLSYTLPREHAGLLNLLFPTAWNILPLISYRSHSKISPLQTSLLAATSPPFPDALLPSSCFIYPLGTYANLV